VEDVCEEEDRTKTGDIGTGDSDALIGCVFSNVTVFEDLDGDGDREKEVDHLLDESDRVTFEITSGNATFAGGGFCEAGGFGTHDHDGDGLHEHCHPGDDLDLDPIAGGIQDDDKFEADMIAVGTGAVNVEFCHDPDAGDDTAAGHGCGDASGEFVDTANKNAEADFEHVHQRFLEDYNADTTCHTGAVSKNKPANSVVNLVGCVQDEFENGAAGIPVLWRVIAGIPAQFVSVEQTTDAAGTSDAAITAPASAEGSATTVRFCTDFNNNGICDSDPADTATACPGLAGECQADVQITWLKATQPTDQSCPQVGGYDNSSGTRSDDNLKGDGDCDKIRGLAGNDKIKGRGEDDRLFGGKGNDKLNGGTGDDVCIGNAGKDRFKNCETIRKR